MAPRRGLVRTIRGLPRRGSANPAPGRISLLERGWEAGDVGARSARKSRTGGTKT